MKRNTYKVYVLGILFTLGSWNLQARPVAKFRPDFSTAERNLIGFETQTSNSSNGSNGSFEEPLVDNGKTRFQQIADKFDDESTAKPAFFNDVRGFWSGRCFDVGLPDRSTNSLFAVYEDASVPGDNDGPEFPQDMKKIAGFLVQLNNQKRAFPGNYWDKMPEDEVRRNARDVLQSRNGKESVIDDHHPLVIPARHKGKIIVVFSVKKSAEYILVEAATPEDNLSYFSDALGKMVRRKKAGPVSYCYFFNKRAEG